MSDTQQTQPAAEDGGEQAQQQEQGKTFTQAEVDQIVKDRAERIYRQRVGDVDIKDLKAKAAGAQTVEQQLADLKAQNAKIQRDNLAARIAAAHGIGPEDADLFLTGNDEETLTTQAKRLAERESERKKNNNVVPREGNNPKPGTSDVREFTRGLFGNP